MVIRNYLFHRVSDEVDTMWPPVKPGLFKSIIRQLTRNFQVVPLELYLDDPQAFKSKKRIATVLFDDGYKDNIEFAAPILKEYNCPASFYVATDCINRNIPTWTFIMDHILQQTSRQKLEFDYDYVPVNLRNVPLKQGGKQDPARGIKPWMKKLSNPRRIEILESIMRQCNDVPVARDKMMNWDDVRQLANDGFIIGSHSHTHPMLASLESEKEIADELGVSFSTIKQEIGKEPAIISYPIGSYDKRVINIAKTVGYKYGLAVTQQFYNSSVNDCWEIPRVELHQEPWWKVQIRINGIYSHVKKVWA